MLSNDMLSNKITIMVNSCDSYEDLWIPFFTLLKKYWNPEKIRIILNTESKHFSMDGLTIDCVHFSKGSQYGERMLHALEQIKTEYILLLLDDFFLRKPADTAMIAQILSWMDKDGDIACFNTEAIPVYADWELDKYPGFRRVPPGTQYALNMQAAVWRTRMLKQFWMPEVSPWEWEAYCNLLQYKYPKNKIYCTTDFQNSFLDYGHHRIADVWAVVRGKWVLEDVNPLFEKENINVDLSKRGYYKAGEPRAKSDNSSASSWYGLLQRCLGIEGVLLYIGYRVDYKICRLIGKECNSDFFLYLSEKAQKSFKKKFFK